MIVTNTAYYLRATEMAKSCGHAAFHEAGHAVIAHDLGLTLDYVKIWQQSANNWTGEYRVVHSLDGERSRQIAFAGILSEIRYEAWYENWADRSFANEVRWAPTDDGRCLFDGIHAIRSPQRIQEAGIGFATAVLQMTDGREATVQGFQITGAQNDSTRAFLGFEDHPDEIYPNFCDVNRRLNDASQWHRVVELGHLLMANVDRELRIEELGPVLAGERGV